MIDQTTLTSRYGWTCAHDDSWAFVNHAKRFIVIRLFEEQYRNLVYSPEWKPGNEPANAELFKYLALVEHQGYHVKAVPVKGYWDPYKRRFAISGYHEKTLFDARLEIDPSGVIRWFPFSSKLPVLHRLREPAAPVQHSRPDTTKNGEATGASGRRSVRTTGTVGLKTLEEASSTFKYDWIVSSSKADLFAVAFQAKWHDFTDHQRLFLGSEHIATYIRTTGVIFANFREDIMNDVIKFYGKQ